MTTHIIQFIFHTSPKHHKVVKILKSVMICIISSFFDGCIKKLIKNTKTTTNVDSVEE